jgi:MFS family permease
MQTLYGQLNPLQRTLSLAVVIGSTFFLGLAHGVGYPLTSITFERWGAPGWVTGLAAGMPALAALVVLPFAPKIAGRLGLVSAMAWGCFLGIAGFALLPIWLSVEGWMVLRFLMGIGVLFPWLLAETWINTVSNEATRGRVLSLYLVALLGGYGCGPIVLGYMPIDGFAPFAVGAGALLLTSIPLMIASRLAPAMQDHGSRNVLSMFRKAPIGMVAALVAGMLEYSYISLLPAFALRQGLPESTALQLVSAFLWGGVALSFLLGWLADRMNRTQLFFWLLVGFALLAVPAGIAVGHPVFALAATFVLGGIACTFYTLGLAILGERIVPRDLASANAAFLILYQIGTLGGPPVAGATMDMWPAFGFLASVISFAAMAAVVVIGISFVSLKERNRITR